MTRFERRPVKLPELGNSLATSGLLGKTGYQMLATFKTELKNKISHQKTSERRLESKSPQESPLHEEKYSPTQGENRESEINDNDFQIQESNELNKNRTNSVRFTEGTPPASPKKETTPLKTSKSASKLNEEHHKKIPPSKIPPEYHKKEQSPLLPSLTTAKDEPVDHRDGEWNRTWFPSAYPRERREVLQLADTFEKMIQEVQSETEGAAQIEKEQRVYDIVLSEVIRQVYVECFDRGVILEKVSNKYRELFSKVPQLVSSMKQERDSLREANKSLSTLLERLMEEKSEVENGYKLVHEKFASLEKAHGVLLDEHEEIVNEIKFLREEKELASQDARRFQEGHKAQETTNSQLAAKNSDNEAKIELLKKQFDELQNRYNIEILQKNRSIGREEIETNH